MCLCSLVLCIVHHRLYTPGCLCPSPQVAQRTKVDAVWPGWGHASEIPDLPESLRKKGIAFLGPPAGPMAALGDKIGSSIIAQAAAVPTLAWSGSKVRTGGNTRVVHAMLLVGGEDRWCHVSSVADTHMSVVLSLLLSLSGIDSVRQLQGAHTRGGVPRSLCGNREGGAGLVRANRIPRDDEVLVGGGERGSERYNLWQP